MATSSTVPTVKARLVTEFTTALATASPAGGQVQVAYAWPGSNTQLEVVFLGYHPDLRDIRLEALSEIPTIKAGRKHRQETYTVPVTVWTFDPKYTADKAQQCEARAFALFDPLQDALADDPQIGLSAIQSAMLGDYAATLWPFNKGWACELVFEVNVAARLT